MGGLLHSGEPTTNKLRKGCVEKQLIKLLTDLVAYKTSRGNQADIDACFEYISEQLKFLGWIEKDYESEGFRSKVWLSQETLEPDILLNAHLDVVPGSDGMFDLQIDGDKLLGRGVSDMKFAIATFIVALKELHRSGQLPTDKSLGIMINSDEEIGGTNGVGYLVEQIGYRPKFVLIPDGGDNWKIVESAKGVLRVTAQIPGKSAHASRPWEGESAIDNLNNFISRLRREFPEPTVPTNSTTVNLGKVTGGQQTNQVCDFVELIMDIRYNPQEGEDQVFERLKQVADNVKLQITLRADGFTLSPVDHPLVNKWRQIIKHLVSEPILIHEHGASDGRYFSAKGSTVLLSKPIGGLIHTESEWLSKQSFVDYTKYLIEFLM